MKHMWLEAHYVVRPAQTQFLINIVPHLKREKCVYVVPKKCSQTMEIVSWPPSVDVLIPTRAMYML